MTEKVERTKAFLLQKFEESGYYAGREIEKAYRLEHTMRVANLGKQIAEAEGMDAEALTIACLLHDVSYCEGFADSDAWRGHGRRAAQIARPFLTSLGLAPQKTAEICYGIAIHVDDQADFEGEKTPFARSVGDADNLDRFDAYRIYETLESKGYSTMPLYDKRKMVNSMLARLDALSGMELATGFAAVLWKERMAFYRAFYERLAGQLAASVFPACM